MAETELGRELRRVDWSSAEWRTSLLCLPAMAIALVAPLALGHRYAALVMAGSAQSVGFGSFQRPLWFRGGAMIFATVFMALSAALGELAANRPAALILLIAAWGFCYGMSNAISSPAAWVGQQSCIFLIVSSIVPGAPAQAALRAGGVLAGGLLQFLCIVCLWRFFKPARSTQADPVLHAPGWQRRALAENFTYRSSTFRYAILLAISGFIAQFIASHVRFHNAYWIPMTVLIILKPDVMLTNARSIARIAGTLVGAVLATVLAYFLQPGGHWLGLLIMASVYLAYALQNVNYALYSIPLTAYIAFILAVGHLPARNAAEYRVIATAIAGLLAMIIHSLYVRQELKRLARSLLPARDPLQQ